MEGSKGSVLVRMEGITKRFPGVLANDNVSFELRAGEVHALLGENGAGKTTLMNILYGLYRPDEGMILIEGREADIRSPKDAISLGIGMVHQHFKLIPTLTVAENVALGLERTGFFMPTKVVEGKIRELSERYGLKVDPKAKVWQLSVGERQRVEIIKVLMRDAKVLILDEPTTVLAPAERDQLFSVMRRLAEEGRGIIFITHKLGEVKAVSDRVTVLRKGRVVVSGIPTDSVSTHELARMMVGRELKPSVRGGGGEGGPVVLEVKGLSVLGDRGLLAVKGVSFEVRGGEIL
ncbi:MAG: heme ABC transporter ATP-binding protein, partial [Thermoplasmata archaeon]